MKTNFFELIAGIGFTGNLQIIINQSDTGTQTVSVLPSAKDPKSTIGKNLPPLLLKATPQELNDTFFQHLINPIKQTEKVFVNAEAYQRELEKAKKQASPEKDKKATATTAGTVKADTNLFSAAASYVPVDDDPDEEADEQPDESEQLAEKQRLYDEAMQKVNTLNGQMKYAEAIAQLPDPEEYPDKAEEIKNKGEALLKRQEMYVALQQEV